MYRVSVERSYSRLVQKSYDPRHYQLSYDISYLQVYFQSHELCKLCCSFSKRSTDLLISFRAVLRFSWKAYLISRIASRWDLFIYLFICLFIYLFIYLFFICSWLKQKSLCKIKAALVTNTLPRAVNSFCKKAPSYMFGYPPNTSLLLINLTANKKSKTDIVHRNT